jgi:serine/threonine protein kinase
MEEEVVAKDRGEAPLRIKRKPGDLVLGATLLETQGKGNCAVVWKAKDTDGSSCAVKIFEPPEQGDWAASHTAFMRGTQTMERLGAFGAEVPRTICKVRRTSGAAIVTDFADHGGSVDLPALRWPPRRVAVFFKSVCEAVAFAHEKGVYHRCLKPSNILIGEDFQPFVTDFDMIDHPAIGANAGGYKPYLAPETLRGERPESAAADIYSLGRILYFLLLGEDPDEPVQEIPDLLPLVERDQPVGLVRIIRKCTSSDPDRRYPHVQALLADLDRYDNALEVGVDVDAESPASQRVSASFARRGGGNRRSGEAPPSSKRITSTDGSWDFEYTEEVTEPPPVTRRSAALHPARAADLSPAPGPSLPPLLSRPLERTIAVAGGLGLLATLGLLFASPVPSATLLRAIQITGSVGVALLTFALPPHHRRQATFRTMVALAAGIAVYLLDPSRLAVLRLSYTMKSSHPAARAAAVKSLAREGKRRFDGKDLSALDLSRADFGQTSFVKAILREVNLSNCYLVEANFQGADLTDAAIYGADLTSASIEGAEGWTTVRCDRLTRLPESWDCKRGHPAPSARGAPDPGSPAPSAPPALLPAPALADPPVDPR